MEWKLPGPDEDGYLRRRREISTLLDAAPSPDNIDSLAKYIAQFVSEPLDEAEALEAVLDMPQKEYQGVIGRLLGFTMAPVPDPKGAPSATP